MGERMKTIRGTQVTLPKKYTPGFMEQLDRRSIVYRELKTAYMEILQDCGGRENLSHTKRSLAERFIFLEALLQTWEQKIASGKADEETLGRWVQAVNSLQGLAKLLGLNRVPRKTKNLKQYIADQEDDE